MSHMPVYPPGCVSDRARIEYRLSLKTVEHGDDECWGWTGATTSNGYAHFARTTLYGETRSYPNGHVVRWALHNGRWPEKGEVVMHTCDNPPCTNPRHLVLGTQKTNARDRARTGRWFGMRTGKLTPEQVLYVRNSPKTQMELARELGVSQPTISNIRTGKTYDETGHPRLPEANPNRDRHDRFNIGLHRRWHESRGKKNALCPFCSD